LGVLFLTSSTAPDDGVSSESMFSFMKGNVLVMTITNIFRMFSRSAVNPYFSLYVLALGGSINSIGLINSLGPLASLLIFPIAGYITDRTGRVKLIVVAGYFSAVVYLFYIFTSNWVMLALGSFLLGMTVFQFPAQSALMADSLSSRQRGIGFATSGAIPGAVAVIAPFFAGYLIDKMGAEIAIRYLYALLLVIYFVSTTIRMKFLKETFKRSEPSLGFSNLKELVKESYHSIIDVFKWAPTSLKAFALVTALSFMANAITGPFWVIYAIQVVGLSGTEWGSLLLLYSAFRIAISIPAGIAVDRFGKRKTIVASFILSIISLLYFTHSRDYIDLLAILLTLAVANAFLPTASAALMADVVPREMRGKVMAAFGRGAIIINPGRGGGGPGMGYAFVFPVMFGSLIGGYVYGINPTHPWFLQLVLTIGSLILSLAFIHDPEKAEI